MEKRNGDRLEALRALLSASKIDLFCADQYLRRAEALLGPLCSRERYEHLRAAGEQLPPIVDELRRATQRGDWSRVGALAAEAAKLREQTTAGSGIVAIADAVYGPRLFEPDAAALSLAGVTAGETTMLERARETALADLCLLEESDPDRSDFYRARIEHFERLEVLGEESAGPRVESAHLSEQVRQAIEKGDFDQAERLANALASSRGGGTGRTRAPKPPEGRASQLGAPFPAPATQRAPRLGLAEETLPAAPALNAYLSCCCADRATFPDSSLSEGHRVAESCTCGHPCPPEIATDLRENLDLLMVHPFVTSAGTRYLPWFGAETLLVETIPEEGGLESDGLREALGLRHRQGLSRLEIEDALGTRGGILCQDLGLDPMEYDVVCIPFDAYLRLAAKYGWGRQRQWTHFDGYQLTRELRLRALVGGDAGYGGPHDLCSVDRHYDAERLTVRFAVVRRERFAIRAEVP